MQNAQETKEVGEKRQISLCGIHEKRKNLLTTGKSMIKSNPSRFNGILVM